MVFLIERSCSQPPSHADDRPGLFGVPRASPSPSPDVESSGFQSREWNLVLEDKMIWFIHAVIQRFGSFVSVDENRRSKPFLPIAFRLRDLWEVFRALQDTKTM
eukprot:1137855-Amorphochlora_amoeboformis.AAC.1